VYVDRLVWRYIPDPATAAAALETAEVDFWEQPPLDYVPKIERNPAVGIVTYDVVGNAGVGPPNHLQPPFNNKKARQALTYMVDQERYLQAAVGQAKYYRQSGAYFVSKSEYGSSAGAPGKPDFERARRLMKEAGYDGKPIVVLDPTNIAMLHGRVPRDRRTAAEDRLRIFIEMALPRKQIAAALTGGQAHLHES